MRSRAHFPQMLDASIFEPGLWQPDKPKKMPDVVPTPTREHLGTPVGLLFQECFLAPVLPAALPLCAVQPSSACSDLALLYTVASCVAMCYRRKALQLISPSSHPSIAGTSPLLTADLALISSPI